MRPTLSTWMIAALCACTATCATLGSEGGGEPRTIRGHLAKVRRPHPINKGPRWAWYFFDLEDGGQIIVYTHVFIPCAGVSELDGSWITTTAEPEPGGGAPVTERQFYVNRWSCP